MAKMIQIRHVPDQLHRELKTRAASEGLTLSDFILRELRRTCSYPSQAEIVARIRARGEVKVATPPEELLRAERDSR